jgi:hypothetical protein
MPLRARYSVNDSSAVRARSASLSSPPGAAAVENASSGACTASRTSPVELGSASSRIASASSSRRSHASVTLTASPPPSPSPHAATERAARATNTIPTAPQARAHTARCSRPLPARSQCDGLPWPRSRDRLRCWSATSGRGRKLGQRSIDVDGKQLGQICGGPERVADELHPVACRVGCSLDGLRGQAGAGELGFGAG